MAKLSEQGQLQVKVLEGPNFLDAKPTGQTETVGKLLGPVTAQDVPIIRCIGLNYKTHSTAVTLSHHRFPVANFPASRQFSKPDAHCPHAPRSLQSPALR